MSNSKRAATFHGAEPSDAAAANRAELAALDAQPHLCPECLAGKHGNCDGTALDPQTDEVVGCDCLVHS